MINHILTIVSHSTSFFFPALFRNQLRLFYECIPNSWMTSTHPPLIDFHHKHHQPFGL